MKTKKLYLSLLLAVASAGLSGCGSDSNSNPSAATSAQTSASLNSVSPAGSSSNGLPVATPVPGGSGSLSGPTIPNKILSVEGHGSASTVGGVSAPVVKYAGLSHGEAADSLRMDGSLRIRFEFGNALKNIDPRNPSLEVGISTDYSIFEADVTLQVNGRDTTTRTLRVVKSSQYSSIVDFSDGISVLRGAVAPATISFKISNVRTNYHKVNGTGPGSFCYEDYLNCCSAQDYWGNKISLCSPGNAQHQTCSNYYRQCVNPDVMTALSMHGWSVKIQIETNSTPRLQ